MPRDARACLWDVKTAADEILAFTRGMTETSYRAHAMARAAVERKFEIIGEALNQLSRVDGVLAARVPDLRVIVDFRNALIHGYAVIDDGRVWRIVEEHVPDLRRKVSELLTELG